MSVNRREEILARLFAICEAQDVFLTKVRNRGLLANDILPAIALLDGNETSKTNGGGRGRGRMSPAIVTMRPQIFLLGKDKKPTNELVGQTLNTYRGVLVKAIAADAQLLALIGPNGDMTYDEAVTDLNTGMQMKGEMHITLSITVPMDPYA